MTSVGIQSTHTVQPGGGVDQIETEAELGLKLLGYTVMVALKDIEVDRTTALGILQPLGLDKYLPGLPESITILRRAVKRWMQSLATKDLGLDEEDKVLLRDITRRSNSDTLALALVGESSDLKAWGLSYLVGLRVFFNKTTGILSLTRNRSIGYVSAPLTAEDAAFLKQLEPHWQYYSQVYIASDLSRMAQRILVGMQSANMRREGGTYFVPYTKRDELQQLKELIEVLLPAAPGKTNGSKLSALALIDRPKTRQQVAHLMHQSFISEITALEKDLQRFVDKTQQEWTTKKGEKKHGKVRSVTINARLDDYKNMRKKIELYQDILADRQEGLFSSLDQLQKTANSLVDTYTDALAEEILAGQSDISQPQLLTGQDEEESGAEEKEQDLEADTR